MRKCASICTTASLLLLRSVSVDVDVYVDVDVALTLVVNVGVIVVKTCLHADDRLSVSSLGEDGGK